MNHATASRLALSFQIAYLYRWKRIATFNNLYWENSRQYYVTWKHFQAKNETYFIVARKTCVLENFGPVSKSWKRFWWVSKSRFRVIFASRICLLFFLYGLKGSNFSEFMGTACRTELVDYWDSLPLAFSVIFFSCFVALRRNFRCLESRAQIFLSQSRKTSNFQFYTPSKGN